VDHLVKERLTGAIILVVLIVLLVPELLSGPKGPATTAPAVASNSSEEPPLRSYTINLADDSHSRSEAAGSSGPAMPQPSGPDQPATPQSVTSDAAAPPAAGSSAQATNPQAQAVNPQTPASQIPGPQTSAPAPKTKPVPAKPSAKPVPAKSSAVAGNNAAKPAKARPSATATSAANTAPTSESGWVVQLGVFASRENAERLALEVRVKGFKASVSPIMVASRKLYRVRVGPTPDRAAAQELQGRLRAAGRPVGTVVPYS
jgi:DedD protein